jgi:hypothetical protein
MALSVLASAVLVIIVSLSLMASEGSKSELEASEEQSSRPPIFTTLISSTRSMPLRSWLVCKIQFFAWLVLSFRGEELNYYRKKCSI